MVLRETTDPQEVRFIPRKYAPIDVKVTLRDEQTNTSTSFTTTLTIDRYYVYFTEVLDLKEDRHYVMEVTDDVVSPSQVEEFYYIAKVFCTNQTDYSINDGQYEPRETTNEYIVLDD